jgi:hypothetical protein
MLHVTVLVVVHPLHDANGFPVVVAAAVSVIAMPAL